MQNCQSPLHADGQGEGQSKWTRPTRLGNTANFRWDTLARECQSRLRGLPARATLPASAETLLLGTLADAPGKEYPACPSKPHCPLWLRHSRQGTPVEVYAACLPRQHFPLRPWHSLQARGKCKTKCASLGNVARFGWDTLASHRWAPHEIGFVWESDRVHKNPNRRPMPRVKSSQSLRASGEPRPARRLPGPNTIASTRPTRPVNSDSFGVNTRTSAKVCQPAAARPHPGQH